MNSNARGGLSTLLLMPSFYGGVLWVFWLLLYDLRLIAWDSSPLLADVVFLIVPAFYIVSTIMWYDSYRRWHRAKEVEMLREHANSAHRLFLLLATLHAIGFLGIALYVRAFASALGGIQAFAQLLVGGSAFIRRETELTSSFGTQLSYLGWVAIGLTVFEYRRGRLGTWWLLVSGVQFMANLLYIDRTRPFTIVFTSAMLILLATPPSETRRIVVRASVFGLILGAIFMVVAAWIGKVAIEGQYGASILPLWAQTFYSYGTQGFAYCSHMLQAHETITYAPQRALYPALKALAALHLTPSPPSQLNDYYSVPFPANVGTFLEPFYHDGGMGFAFVAIALHSFGLDWLGLAFLRT